MSRSRLPARRAAAFPALAALAAAVALAACGENGSSCDPTEAGCRRTPRTSMQIGDLVRLNARTDNACDTATRSFRTGRVVAMSNRAVIVADTGNPAGGFTTAEYESVAAAFDTLVYPVDVRNFGEPTDLDGNGRSIIFYTRAVNELTPANSGFVIGGFFWNRDLFPRSGGSRPCAGSNDGELFYMLVPDPNGTINNNRRTKESVLGGTVAVIAHEFQHLINASRRLYVLRTNNFDETTWLNEGLSHVAEELSFYRAAGLSPAGQPGQSPRARLTIQAVRDRPGGLAALNTFNAQNLSRFSRYLRVTADSSPYADNDGLATRGATWAFLRYSADRIGQPDSVFLRRLVNSTLTGYENVAAATGAGSALPDWFRDWAVANYADGLVAVPPRFAYASWNFRSVLPSVATNNNAYPLATRPLADGQAATTSLGGGTAAYFTFTVPAGGTATVRTRAGTAAPSNSIRLTLVRVTDQSGAAVTPYEPGQGADLTVANSGGASAQYALVVFNGSSNVTTREAITVTGTGLGGAPLASSAAAVEAAAAAAQAGPTRARLDASAESLPVTDAPLHRQLRAIGERELAPRVAAARAVYDARRSAGAERQ